MIPYTRRDFAKFALTALPAVGVLSATRSLGAAESNAMPAAKPNSTISVLARLMVLTFPFSSMGWLFAST